MKMSQLIFVVIIAIVVCFGVAMATGCTKSKPETGSPYDFESIKLAETGSMAGESVLEAVRVNGGVKITSAFVDHDNKRQGEKTYKGDESAYQKIVDLLADYDVKSWDGYSESDPNVLDGSGYSADIVLADGTTINAHGSNCAPTHYFALHDALRAYLD